MQTWQSQIQGHVKFMLGLIIVLLVAALIVAVRPWLGWDAEPVTIPAKGASPATKGTPLLRLHVIANSDAGMDQNIKHVVRDVITRYLQESGIANDLSAVATVAEALDKAEDHKDALIQLVREVLDRLGSPYDVQVLVGRHWYDGRYYGNLWVPPGRYPSLQVVLGEGRGSNWWCVLFAPICAVPPATFVEPPAEDEVFIATDRTLYLTAEGQLLVLTEEDDAFGLSSAATKVQIRSVLWDWLKDRWPVQHVLAGIQD